MKNISYNKTLKSILFMYEICCFPSTSNSTNLKVGKVKLSHFFSEKKLYEWQSLTPSISSHDSADTLLRFMASNSRLYFCVCTSFSQLHKNAVNREKKKNMP